MSVQAFRRRPGGVCSLGPQLEQWHQHDILTQVQWSFNDSPATVAVEHQWDAVLAA